MKPSPPSTSSNSSSSAMYKPTRTPPTTPFDVYSLSNNPVALSKLTQSKDGRSSFERLNSGSSCMDEKKGYDEYDDEEEDDEEDDESESVLSPIIRSPSDDTVDDDDNDEYDEDDEEDDEEGDELYKNRTNFINQPRSPTPSPPESPSTNYLHKNPYDLHTDNQTLSKAELNTISLQQSLSSALALLTSVEDHLTSLSTTELSKTIHGAVHEFSATLEKFGSEIEKRNTVEGGRRDVEAMNSSYTCRVKGGNGYYQSINNNGYSSNTPTNTTSSPQSIHSPHSQQQDDDIQTTLSLLPSILTDISSSLHQFTPDDAEELAEVGLVCSVICVGLVKGSLGRIDFSDASGRRRGKGGFERLDDDDYDDDDDDDEYKEHPRRSPHTNTLQLQKRKALIFWPHLLPLLQTLPLTITSSITSNKTIEQLLLVGLTPTMIICALLSTPAVIADESLRQLYLVLLQNEQHNINANKYKAGTISNLATVEIQLLKISSILRLQYLLTKLTVTQSTRVLKRQLKRKNGVSGLLKRVAAKGVDIVLSPVESFEVVKRIGVGWWGFVKGVYDSY